MAGGEGGTAKAKPIREFVSRFRSPLAATFAIALTAVLAYSQTGPFNEAPPTLGQEPSLWRLLLSERLTLGFVRLALAAGAVFLLTSIFVLVANNRWIVKLSATEVSTEELDRARETIRKYEEQVEQLTRERDEYRSLVEYRDMVEMETAPDG